MAADKKRKAGHAPSFATKKARIGEITEGAKQSTPPKKQSLAPKPIKSALKSPKLPPFEGVKPDAKPLRKRKSAADFITVNEHSSDEGWDGFESPKGKDQKKSKRSKSSKGSKASGNHTSAEVNDKDQVLFTPPKDEQKDPEPSDFESPERTGVKALSAILNGDVDGLERQWDARKFDRNGDKLLGSEDEDEDDEINWEDFEDDEEDEVDIGEQIADDEDEEGNAESEVDHEALLKAFASDSESGQDEADAIPLKKLAKAPRPSEALPKVKPVSQSAKDNDPESIPGTIYLGRIPHGFYEQQLRHYFSQFGDISKLRLSRNKKTGASKHYGFIEFESKSVADIVARTMNNYLLYGHLLKCELLSEEQLKAINQDGSLWRGANKKFKVKPNNMLERKAMQQPKGKEAWDRKIEKEKQKRRKQAEMLKSILYDFEAPELEGTEKLEEARSKITGADAAEGEAAENGAVKQLTAGANEKGDDVVLEVLKGAEKPGKKGSEKKSEAKEVLAEA